MKRALALIAVAWTGILLAAFYVVQKPPLAAFAGLADTLWTLLITALLLFNAYALGKASLRWAGWRSDDDPPLRLLLSLGIGMGILGILGLLFSLVQIANPPLLRLSLFLLTLFFLLSGNHRVFQRDARELARELHLHASGWRPLERLALLLLLLFSFALSLAPQFEAFDALLYHLTQPARILQDGGIQPINIPHFWFPNLTENLYLWGLAFKAERSAQLMHFTWGVLTAALLFLWASRTWGGGVGRKTILLLAVMPSLPIVASWAYADMALCYYTAAALFLVARFKTAPSLALLNALGIVSGLAMGVKYTSFVLPLACGLLLLLQRPFSRSFRLAAHFSAVAILTALPWYLRNAAYMNNPFYPFAFGGRYWDDFLANWYAAPGTGIGWDFLQLLRLPLDATLGYRDANYFDGRIGPLFLILLPAAIWILLTAPRRDSAAAWSLTSIGFFSALSFAAWTYGVIQSSALWQTRLLFPALLPFAIPAALGWDALTRLDTSNLRLSFLFNTVVRLVLALTVFETGLFTLQRNPLAAAVGAQTREQYIARVDPSYAALIQIMEGLPANARMYSLFEPRSYALPRSIQPDPIVANFAHDLHLYKTPQEIIRQWKAQGYSYILVYERGRQFMLENNLDYQSPTLQNALAETLALLSLTRQTADGVYSIYQIP
ncbi:MAG: ArnT family glycosyltransferase [Chloroflexota bacterium]|nr:glycosyltransferase family 39 protein [Chloroflexota bacterium]MBI5704026.1 glycosyltransferase family 39 protein [Chloroflexota bacterium]